MASAKPSTPLAPWRWRWLLAALAAGAFVAATTSCGPAATLDGGGHGGDGDSQPAYDMRHAAAADKTLADKRIAAVTMGSMDLFTAWSSRVADERYVRFLVDLRTKGVTYFDSNVYPLHVDFVFGEIYAEELTPERLAEFMRNYETDKPEFILGYMVHHIAPDLWTWSHWEGDTLTHEHLQLVYERLQATSFSGPRLRFRPDSEHHAGLTERLPSMPTLTNDEIYGEVTYQLFNTGERVGRLTVARTTQAALEAERTDILILPGPVADLGVVSGIVSEEFSTPLSHVALRARAWGVPHIGQKNASQLYKHLENEVVFFKAGEHSAELRRATPEEIARLEQAMRAARDPVVPPVDLGPTALAPLTELTREDAAAYGAKTSNLGTIAQAQAAGKATGFDVPPGFGVPISHYRDHMTRHGLDKRVEALLKDAQFLDDKAYRIKALEELRGDIARAPLDPELLDEVWALVEKLGIGQSRGLAVRSSTNAEDLPGFSGAGIYDTFLNVKGKDQLSQRLRDVWASVWNLRAYEERSFYGIDHLQVFGAVLVQEAVAATAAGVLVTTNLYKRGDRSQYTINAKSGLGIRVVDGHKMPEQILVDAATMRMRVLSRSDEETMLVFDAEGGVREVPNPQQGEPVLTEARVKTLVRAAKQVVELFPKDSPQDIEWLFVGDTLAVVQARPYVEN